MKLLTGLFRAAKKRVMTTDNDMGMFREKLNELVEKKAELPDEEVAKRVEELKEMTIDLPDEEEKAKLNSIFGAPNIGEAEVGYVRELLEAMYDELPAPKKRK